MWLAWAKRNVWKIVRIMAGELMTVIMLKMQVYIAIEVSIHKSYHQITMARIMETVITLIDPYSMNRVLKIHRHGCSKISVFPFFVSLLLPDHTSTLVLKIFHR